MRTAPLWAGRTTLVLSTAHERRNRPAVELVNRARGARYDLPGRAGGIDRGGGVTGGTRLALATADGRRAGGAGAGRIGSAQSPAAVT